jgi:hypothetical protein
MKEPTSTGRRSNWLFSVIVGAMLCYLIGSATFSTALINTKPAIATAWWPRPPLAGVGVADERIRVNDFKGALKAANWALSREPLNVAALRDAGLAHAKLGQPQGEPLLLFAGTRSWRDLPTELWLLWRNIRTRRFDAGIQDADAVLRVAADQHTDLQVRALLAAAAVYPPTAKPLVQALAASPPWRPEFLITLANSAASSNACDILLAGLSAGPNPPTTAEYSPCVNRIAQEGHYDQALGLWRRLASATPGAGGLVRDGRFSHAGDDSDFTWNLGAGSGGQLVLASYPGTGGGGGLEVDYDGVSSPPLARQLLVLPPGSFTAKGNEDTTSGPSDVGGPDAGVRWQVVCASSQALLGQSDLFGPKQGEQAFSFQFTVPVGCPAEWLRAMPVAGERPHEITVWFTGIAVAGSGASPPATPAAGAAQPSTAGAH